MEKILQILKILIAFYLFYIFLSALQITNIFNETRPEKYLYSQKLDKIYELVHAHKAEKVQDSALCFTPEYQAEILNKGKVIIDSSIVETYQENGYFYVKVDIGNDWFGRVSAKLGCDEELYKQIRMFEFKTVLMVADINKIVCSDYDLIALRDDKQVVVEKSKNIVLSGECLEVVQLSAF
ncbi:MAG: hypothetical protein CVV23_00440 [Ignavibacteriae bacterium HGW-Ignavibacteriae-2]|jgi:hypothetical protein|nr:MAG: hypothetical protein CVV23_00440 [Ignavibacteriae bacterium HGW-Ignavibacteriae-2]